MAREWVRAGHSVTILAASHSHVRSTQPHIQSTFTKEEIEGIQYIWAKTLPYTQNGLKRFMNMLVFIARIFQYFLKSPKNTRPDAVIASSTYPLDIYPAFYISKISRAKLFFEVHDLWPLSPIELGGMKKTHPFIILMQMAENFAYKYSDKVISMLPKTLNYMMEHGLDSKKLSYIPNGIDLEEWAKLPNPDKDPYISKILEKVKNDQLAGYFTIAYLGTHGLANALDNFINAAEILKNHKMKFYLIGGGPDKKNLQILSQNKKLEHVNFIDSIPKHYIPLATQAFDCNYIGLQKQPLFRFGISPNKLMDYMAAQKPIIAAFEAGNDIIKEAQCGINVPAENPQALANGILQMTQLSKEERTQMGKNGYDFVKKHHDYKVLSKKFLNELS
jgi:glycosyltransferase involved in cell wall biosynthesis